jgi:hypothetical protein
MRFDTLIEGYHETTENTGSAPALEQLDVVMAWGICRQGQKHGFTVRPTGRIL